jgi:hypothetical protein
VRLQKGGKNKFRKTEDGRGEQAELPTWFVSTNKLTNHRKKQYFKHVGTVFGLYIKKCDSREQITMQTVHFIINSIKSRK